MYHIGYYLFQKNMDMTGYYITGTLQIAGVIVAVIFLVDAIFRLNFLGNFEKNVDKSVKIV